MPTTDKPSVYVWEESISIQEIVGWGLLAILVVSFFLGLLITSAVLCRRLFQRTRQYNVDTVSTSSVARQEIPDLSTSRYQDPPLTQVLQNKIITFEEQTKKDVV